MELLVACVAHWYRVLGHGDGMVVTVDGDEAAWKRVYTALAPWTSSVWRVGQPTEGWNSPLGVRDGRLGVAANKNTGLEAMVAPALFEHLWLSDDDTWPLSWESLRLHHDLRVKHSLVCWGRHRRMSARDRIASWTWPRGAAMYVHWDVVAMVGGFIEAFGPGGHEHVEWSRRIHQHGFTPFDYVSPVAYAAENWMGARSYWHAEDMARPGEPVTALIARRRRLTSVRREPQDPSVQSQIMEQVNWSTEFVPYAASDNRRWSATLSPIVGAVAPDDAH